ncbi:flagellar protein FliT [Noviherbaspirillum pedocola]|uniref:Flagellar protein FliT n=1 Tax=Noviherbaspirillum pedocola TaxID=2801341 RepID=A0A934W7Q9_9BURK|nr:flagellar protein FliT [Noviherbaspirillum pedocola]MBK4735898.1 flagellar protein FliT [Noviherbaspirillum pedocola]
MMDSETVIKTYEAMAATSRDMLAAVQAREWDTFAGLEKHVSELVEQLRQGDSGQYDTEIQTRKSALITEVLSLHRQTNDLLIPWRSAVGAMLGGVSASRRLVAAYGCGKAPG